MSEKGKEEELHEVEEGYLSRRKKASKLRVKELKVLTNYMSEDDALKLMHEKSKTPKFGQRKVVRFSFDR